MNSIKLKLLFILLFLSLAPLASLGIFNYYQTTEIFGSSIQDFLLTTAKTKNDALENYISETEKLGEAISQTDVVQRYLEIVKNNDNPSEDTEFSNLRSRLENILYSFQEANWGKYHHIFLIDKSKKIAISPNHGKEEKGSPSSHLNEDTSDNEWAMQALLEGKTSVSDYSSWVESDHSHQMLFFPVKDADQVTHAVLGFELQIPYEQELLTENFELGETGRVFLATTDGVPIVYKGIENQEPLGTPGIEEVQRTGISSDRRQNAEGVEVIDLYLKNEKYPWILVAEVEAEEAFSSLYTIQQTIILALLITFVVVLIFSILFANFIVNPIKLLTQQMEDISLGNMDIKVSNLDRKDELGRLAQAFNRMVMSVKIMMRNYKK